MSKEKKHMFMLSPIECRLFRHIRKLETESDPDNMILEGDDPKLSKRLKLTFELEGRQVGSFDITGSRLVEECASASVHVVQALLNWDEQAISDVSLLAADDAPTTLDNEQLNDLAQVGVAVSDESEAPETTVATTLTSWDAVKQELIPPYVKGVGFSVTQHDLTAEHRADLKARFPDIHIFCGPVFSCGEFGLGATAAADPRACELFATDTPSVLSTNLTASAFLDTCVSTTSESTPATSKVSSSYTSVDPSGSASRSAGASLNPTSSEPDKLSTLWVVAERIGLKLSDSDEIHSMWSHWQSQHKVRSFAAVRGRGLDQFYEGLVMLYVLGYHSKQYDLCFAVLLMFQNSNYKYKNKMPSLTTAALAFQYLPEDNDLCRWISTLFAFLWGTQEYKTCEELLDTFPRIDRTAFSTFMFAIAHIRDPFTKGHDTAVLDQWCKVHRHDKGDAGEALCKEVYGKMEAKFAEIRIKEAEDEYIEAQRLVKEYEKNKRTQTPKMASAPVKGNKRKSDSSGLNTPKKQKKRQSGLS